MCTEFMQCSVVLRKVGVLRCVAVCVAVCGAVCCELMCTK